MKRRGHTGLSNTEFAVLKVLWNATEPLTRPAILEGLSDMDWNPNSIHLVLNGLMEKGFVEVAGMARCGQSYGRTYIATCPRMEYAANQALRAVADLPVLEQYTGIVSNMLKQDAVTPEVLDALEAEIQKRRQELGA